MQHLKTSKWLYGAIIWFIASIHVLLIKPSPQPQPFLFFDLFCHFGLFFGQTWLLAKIFLSIHRPIPVWWILSITTSWVLLSECIASFIPTHSSDVLDALTDIAGIAIALKLAHYIQTLRITFQKPL